MRLEIMDYTKHRSIWIKFLKQLYNSKDPGQLIILLKKFGLKETIKILESQEKSETIIQSGKKLRFSIFELQEFEYKSNLPDEI